jgi:hypothetical protein
VSAFCAQKPSIPFVSKVKKMYKLALDESDADKSGWNKLELLMDPDNPASGSKDFQQFSIFKDVYNFQRSGSSG